MECSDKKETPKPVETPNDDREILTRVPFQLWTKADETERSLPGHLFRHHTSPWG
jgi:hypothetical protein